MKNIAVVGVSHHTASVERREAWALDREGRERASRAALALAGVAEVVVLSTCNRTELFAAAEPGAVTELPVDDLLMALHAGRAASNGSFERGETGAHFDGDAVRHALSLAAGLDSMVLGETQILKQVRLAYEESVERRSVGPVFRHLFPAAFRVAKRAHTETGVSRGAASVGSMAVELATKVFDDLGRRTALLLGAGDTGETIARALTDRRIGRLWIAGRGVERAAALAERLEAHALVREEALQRLDEVDIVLTAARPVGGDWVLTADRVEAARQASPGRQRLVVDVGVPRNVEPAVADLADVFLYDIDDLESLTERIRRRRQKEAAKVDGFVAREIGAFNTWWASAADLDPLLRRLHRRFEEIRDRELARTMKRLPDEAREPVEVFSRSLVDKLLQTPTRRLRDGGDRLVEMARLVRELFDLEDDESDREGGSR